YSHLTCYIGGSWYDHTGGPSNYLCLPPNPVFDGHAVPRYGSSELYGTEYQTCGEPECGMSAVCSVCRVSRSSTLMIPGRDTCNAGWNLEFSGYLMGSCPDCHGNKEYICVDKQRRYVPATKGDENGALLLYTTVHCWSLSCPPYVEGSIVLCAVCSK
ncbi:uncharacterized protein, partial [Littorina saxatilis]|uniref:uncharacterized protein n=1 Tax=Littorina saxatilis TaxID=31220 RepID=UPI0038B4396A